MKQLPKIIAIGGQTATGKSQIARAIAEEFKGETINADSRQIYRQLSVGTAKDAYTKRIDSRSVVIDGIPHHLSDYIDITTPYNLAQYQKDAYVAIHDILSRDRLPILVGGTGLYLDSVIYNFNLAQESGDTKLRSRLREYSVEKLQRILQEKAPDDMNKLNVSDRNNPHRLIRAIERTGCATSAAPKPRNMCLYLVVSVPSDELKRRIEERTTYMFQNGLVDENKNLRDVGFTTAVPALRSIGYQEFDAYFAGTQTLDETKKLVILHTLQYARRQLTWFKRNKHTQWISSTEEALDLVREFLATSSR